MWLDAMKAQGEVTKDKSQLPLDFLKENLEEEYVGAIPSLLRRASLMIQKSIAADKKQPYQHRSTDFPLNS